jgi:hypothetical protein
VRQLARGLNDDRRGCNSLFPNFKPPTFNKICLNKYLQITKNLNYSN